MEIGLEASMTLLAGKIGFCSGIAIGDTESDTGVAYLCLDDDRRDFLLRMTDFVAAQLREQSRFFREHCDGENLHELSGMLCDSRYAVYPVLGEGMEGLFLFVLWNRSAGNAALVDIHVRNLQPLLTLTDTEKSRLHGMRREAWENGTSGLLTHMRRSAAVPMTHDPAQPSEDPLPFEQNDSVLRLLGVVPEETEPHFASLFK